MDTATQRCIVCENASFSPFYEGLKKCTECGHVVADMSISDEELRNLYQKNYFSDILGIFEHPY